VKAITLMMLKVLIVAIGHVSLALWLYQGRVCNKHMILHSDLLVFGLPTLLALCAYGYVIRPEVVKRLPAAPPAIASLSLALIPTIASLEIFLYIAFNRYGT